MKRVYLLVIMCITLLVIAGCQQNLKKPQMGEGDEAAQEVSSESKDKIEVDLMNQEGVPVGTAVLKEVEEGVQISVEAHHLSEGAHGFHVHEKGMCEAPSFESAGGHFNPDHKKHGFKNPEGPHAGDIENLEVGADGTVEQVFVNDRVTLKKGVANSLLNEEGTSLIIHADPDDYISQPAGDAGERIACGVIYKGAN